ncbi:MAG: helix-turn-helix domain-containing protein [bacterium]
MKKCTSDNPVNITLKVVGGKWKALILWYLKEGPMRYSDLGREITGVTQKMLTQQLREMELEGLIERKVYPVVPPKVEYSVTEYGHTLEPVLDALAAWGEKHKKRSL